ncbi:MAG: diadenylate cyclase CdaA [Oscillospiraceae bacterium]|nr:diadenylate cyclase CdaA [Oscillospiraceae bacterium]
MDNLREGIKQVLNVFANIRIVDFLDIAIVAVLFYALFMLVRKTRAAQLTKGIVLLVVISFVASNLNMRVLSDILSAILQFGVLALIIVFQPEIRRMLEQIGHTHIVSLDMFRRRTDNEERRLQTSRAIAAVCDAAEQMSASHTGALMVFERKSSLGEIMGTGTMVNSDVTTEMLNTIFYEGTLLHDGATIIRDGRIAAAGCVLPLSANLEISKEMGTRHRAALGMSENSDAVVVVVSEESGIVSLAKNGVLIRRLDRAALFKILSDDLLPLIEPNEKEKRRMVRSAKNAADATKEKLVLRHGKKAEKASEEQLADAVQAFTAPEQEDKE